jgi:hypothetical protein
MSTFPSLRPSRRSFPPASAVLLGAAVGVALPLTRPGTAGVGVGALALLPLAAVVFAGTVRAATLVAALAYVGVLIWGYTKHFSPLYAYHGLIDAGPAPEAILAIVALAALPAAWLPLSASRPSTVVLWFLYLIGYVPAVVVPLWLTGDLGTVLPLDIALMAAMVILGLVVRLPPLPVTLPHLSAATFTRLLVVLGAVTTAYIAVTFGVNSLPSLGDVYQTRAVFDTELGAAWPAGYIVPWAGNAINPMLMSLGLARKRVDMLMLGLAGQLLIYADTGFKSVLFSIALVPFVYAGISIARRSFGLSATLGSSAVLIFGIVASPLTSEWSLSLVRRLFATPGQIGWYFYDFFSDHPRYELSHSFLRWFSSSPYIEDPATLIGAVYFPDSHPSANANLWADAFANFGLAGIVGFTIVLGVVLLIVDNLGRRRDARVIGPMVAIAGLSLASSALFTSILTLGFGLGCVLMALMPPGSGDPGADTQR